jgi:hypothetical protein
VISKRLIVGLLSAALGLPIVVLVALGGTRLLTALGDHGGAEFIRRVAQLGALAWGLSLVGLIIATAAARLLDETAEPVDLEALEAERESRI